MSEPYFTENDSASVVQEGLEFVEQTSETVRKLFVSNASLHNAIRSVGNELKADLERMSNREKSVPVIAIVGRSGTGKSWLTRLFLTDHEDNNQLRGSIRFGQNSEDRTEKTTWIGQKKPFGFASHEEFAEREKDKLIDLGRAFVVGDTPGIGQADRKFAMLGGKAARSAHITILVTSIDAMRSGSNADFIKRINGGTIIPVIKFKPKPPDQDEPSTELKREVNSEIVKWTHRKQIAEIHPPIYMPDADIYKSSKKVEEVVCARLIASLKPLLANPIKLQGSLIDKHRDRIRVAKTEMVQAIEKETTFYKQIVGPRSDLDAKLKKFPEKLLDSLQKEPQFQLVGIKHAFRVDWIKRTPALFFPYRSLLGILSITQGAWDRLVFAVAGSIPSIFLGAYKTTRNIFGLIRNRRSVDRWTLKTKNILLDEFRPSVQELSTAIENSVDAASTTTRPSSPKTSLSVEVEGLDTLAFDSKRIVDEAIIKYRASNWSFWTVALVGQLSFIWLAAGPVIAIYREFLCAHSKTLSAEPIELWQSFPAPTATMLLSTILLCIAPVALVAMIGMTWCCWIGRANKAEVQIHGQLKSLVKEKMRQGDLSINLENSEYDQVRVLLDLKTSARDLGADSSSHAVNDTEQAN